MLSGWFDGCVTEYEQVIVITFVVLIAGDVIPHPPTQVAETSLAFVSLVSVCYCQTQLKVGTGGDVF